MELIGYRESVLPNGLSILTDYRPPELTRPRVYVNLYIWSGSHHDPPEYKITNNIK